jgi:hypothetical protein
MTTIHDVLDVSERNKHKWIAALLRRQYFPSRVRILAQSVLWRFVDLVTKVTLYLAPPPLRRPYLFILTLNVELEVVYSVWCT